MTERGRGTRGLPSPPQSRRALIRHGCAFGACAGVRAGRLSAAAVGRRQPAQQVGQFGRVERLSSGGQVLVAPPAVAGHCAALDVVEADQANLHLPDTQEIVVLFLPVASAVEAEPRWCAAKPGPPSSSAAATIPASSRSSLRAACAVPSPLSRPPPTVDQVTGCPARQGRSLPEAALDQPDRSPALGLPAGVLARWTGMSGYLPRGWRGPRRDRQCPAPPVMQPDEFGDIR